MMNGVSNHEDEWCDFVEVDPTGRYGRYNEILGKGASKTVYRAFDEYEGIEVAWNQVKLYDFLQNPEDLERLYCEIHLLKTMKHKNIMKFYTSWVDTAKRNINFVTEMFTSGTLRQYRLKHRRVNIRAVKHWCRQILGGLYYLHSHDPSVIHRDLKCDNIFVNGNQGEVKIGDLGLAAILRKSHAAHCVGTPEFMAPEVYEEEYNELVDIYSFGMCILEMVTFEYPYSECNHPAQIYKKVKSGKKPDALYKVKDPEVRQFIDKCLATVSSRLSAKELLNDPFLHIDDYEDDVRLIDCRSELGDFSPFMRQPFLDHCTSDSSYINGYANGTDLESYDWGYQTTDAETSGIELFEHHDDDHSGDVDITIKGKKRDDGSIFLRLRIADKEGRVRNIYFPFDVDLDTALSVATEMVGELDITDQDVTSIADMIDGEIASLVPGWKPGPGIVETTEFADMKLCQNCASFHTSVGSLLDILSNNPGALNSPFIQCANGCAAAMHGRFEEITYQADGSEHEHPVTEASEEATETHHAEIWDHCESAEFSSLCSGTIHSDEDHEKSDQYSPAKGKNNSESKSSKVAYPSDSGQQPASSHPFSMAPSLHYALIEDNESEFQREVRWLKAKHQLELREVRDHQMGMSSKSSTPRACLADGADDRFIQSLHQNLLQHKTSNLSKSDIQQNSNLEAFQRSCPVSRTQRARNCEAMGSAFDRKSFFTSSLLPSTLHRTTSLPVDAVYI